MHCNRATLLLCGPNPASRAYLADNLAADGLDVVCAPSTERAWEVLARRAVDVIVIDFSRFGQVDRDGFELITRIRQSGRLGLAVDVTVPIIAVTPRMDDTDRLRIFQRGGDDLISHPFHYPELFARVDALLRRAQGRWAPSRMRIGGLELDASSRQVWVEGRTVPLTAKEFVLLTVLASAPTRVFTHEELLRRVWGCGAEIRTRTVHVHACRLRRKLLHAREDFVVSAWGEGYKLLTALPSESDGPAGRVTLDDAPRLAGVGGAGASESDDRADVASSPPSLSALAA